MESILGMKNKMKNLTDRITSVIGDICSYCTQKIILDVQHDTSYSKIDVR
jgi:hypothetical protein